MTKYSPQLLEILIKRVNDTVSGDDYVNWAVSALEQRFDTPNLRILAGLASSTWRSDAEPYFDRAVDELHIRFGTHEEILREYAEEIARKILGGEMSAETGAGLMESRVLSPLDHPKDLMAWCYLSGGLDPNTFATLTERELDRAVREQAAILVGDNK